MALVQEGVEARVEVRVAEECLAHVRLRMVGEKLPHLIRSMGADVYFTGALTGAQKSDFAVEYRGEDKRWHWYTPDFVIRKKNGKCLIVEIKAERERHHPVDGEHGKKAIAARRWEDLDPARLRYEMVFVPGDSVPHDKMQPASKFIQEH